MILRLVAAATLLSCAACAAGPTPEPPPAEVEQPLEITIDSVTLRRGGLRIGATMTDGSADVSVWPGTACRQIELGRGFATPSELAWTLTAEEIAIGLECGLVFRVRTRDDDGHRIVRTATLPVAISLDSDEPGARTVEIATHGGETRLAFLTMTQAQRLHAGGLVVGASPKDEPDGTRHTLYQRRTRTRHRLYRSDFDVPNVDLARALVLQRPIGVGGASFDVLATVGGTALDLEKPDE